jgi:hypothetical protein
VLLSLPTELTQTLIENAASEWSQGLDPPSDASAAPV